MSWRWLKPDEQPPRYDPSNFDFLKIEQQRQKAVQAARDMSAESNFFSNRYEDESDEEIDPEDSSEEYERSVVGLIPMKLRYAVMAFNVKCEEDETRFQWFDETIEGPLEVLEAQAEHKKGCELCMCSPTFGEVYFRYNMVSYRDYSKLCESCGTGVLHAALQAAEQDLEGEGEEEEEEEESDEPLDDSSDEDAADYQGAKAQPVSKQRSRARPAAAAAAAAAPQGPRAQLVSKQRSGARPAAAAAQPPAARTRRGRQAAAVPAAPAPPPARKRSRSATTTTAKKPKSNKR